MQDSKAGKYAVYCASLFVPAMFVVGQATTRIFRHYNPSKTDINLSLAYLRQSMVASGIAGGLVLILAMYFIYRSSQSRSDGNYASMAIKILALQLAGIFLIGLVSVIFPVTELPL